MANRKPRREDCRAGVFARAQPGTGWPKWSQTKAMMVSLPTAMRSPSIGHSGIMRSIQ